MNPEAYLQLEQNLRLRLRKAWSKEASPLHTKIQKLVKAGDYDAARGLVMEFDVSSVAEDNREYIKYTLWAFAMLGAAEINDRPALKGLQFDKTMTHVTDVTVRSLTMHTNHAIQQNALQSIASLEAEAAEGLVKKADGRYVEDFVSFLQDGDEAMQLISSLHSTRLTVWGFTAEAEMYGITRYQLTPVLDGRTSEFCRMIAGREFQVVDATSSINTILQAENPDDLRTLQPWPKQDRASLEDFAAMTDEEIVARNWHIPPFHPACRTMLTRTSSEKAKAPTEPVRPVEPTPAYRAKAKDFEDLGVKISEADLEHWNAEVGQSPAQLLAKLSGVTPLEMLEGYLSGKVPLQFLKSGKISFRARTSTVVSDANMIFDPYSRHVYLNYAEAKAGDVAAGAAFFRELHENMLLAASTMSAAAVTVTASGAAGVYAYSTLGYLPDQKAWFKLKGDLLADLDGMRDLLEPTTYQLVSQLLESPQPAALKALVELPLKYKGQQIGKALLQGKTLEMGVSVGQA